MPRAGFSSVSLRDEILEKVDKFIANNSEGFTNRPQVLTGAILQFLDGKAIDRQNVNPVNDAIIEAQIAEHVKELADSKFEALVEAKIDEMLKKKFGGS
ncbi:MAG: hypothetical protein ACPHK8_01470 [Thermoplasmatota archaeon]